MGRTGVVTRMELLALELCELPCQCSICCYFRLKALRDCIRAGAVNEGEPVPGSRLHFARWLVKTRKLSEWDKVAA